jgi:hypothetical protein
VIQEPKEPVMVKVTFSVDQWNLQSLDWYADKLAEAGHLLTRDEVLNLILGHTSLAAVMSYADAPLYFAAVAGAMGAK